MIGFVTCFSDAMHDTAASRQSQIMTLMSAMPSFRPLISTCGWKVDEKPGVLIRACQKDLQKVQDRLIASFVSLFDFWVVETGGVSTNSCKREQKMICCRMAHMRHVIKYRNFDSTFESVHECFDDIVVLMHGRK